MESSGTTDLKISKFRYTWIIQNYEYWFHSGSLESPQFSTTVDNQNLSWKLKLYSDGSLELILCSPHVLPIPLNLYVSLLNTDGKKLAVKRTTCTIQSQNGPSPTLSQYINRDFVLDKRNKLLDGGALSVFCKFTFVDQVTHHPGPIRQANLPTLDSQRRSKHLDDYERLLFSEDFSDFKLVVGGEELPVHRNILAIKSRVFAAMFKHDTTDKKSGRVEILDIEPNIVREMLRFVYVGKVNNIDENAAKLLAAADMYELEELMALCTDELVDKVNMENVDEVLIMLDKYNAKKLKTAMIKFVTKNAKLLNKSEKFHNVKKVLSSSLLAELLSVFMKN